MRTSEGLFNSPVLVYSDMTQLKALEEEKQKIPIPGVTLPKPGIPGRPGILGKKRAKKIAMPSKTAIGR